MCATVIGQSELGTETKVDPYGLSLWSQRKTDPKSEMTHTVNDHSYRYLTRRSIVFPKAQTQ